KFGRTHQPGLVSQPEKPPAGGGPDSRPEVSSEGRGGWPGIATETVGQADGAFAELRRHRKENHSGISDGPAPAVVILKKAIKHSRVDSRRSPVFILHRPLTIGHPLAVRLVITGPIGDTGCLQPPVHSAWQRSTVAAETLP